MQDRLRWRTDDLKEIFKNHYLSKSHVTLGSTSKKHAKKWGKKHKQRDLIRKLQEIVPASLSSFCDSVYKENSDCDKAKRHIRNLKETKVSFQRVQEEIITVSSSAEELDLFYLSRSRIEF